MPAIHQFAYGPLNPIAGYLMASIGSLIGLAAAAQAMQLGNRRRRVPWLLVASATIGTSIWLLHFMAMVGFDISDAAVRYDPGMVAASAVVGIAVVGLGVFVAGCGRQSGGRVVAGGVFIGCGVIAMHYTGMAAVRLSGTIGHDLSAGAAALLVAVVGATAALWFALAAGGWWPRCTAAVIMGGAITGAHYAAMVGVRVQLRPEDRPVSGISPIMLVLPITVVAAATLIGLVFTALQAATQEQLVPAHRVRFTATAPARPTWPYVQPSGTTAQPEVVPEPAQPHGPVPVPVPDDVERLLNRAARTAAATSTTATGTAATRSVT